jgi:hypothetical protein
MHPANTRTFWVIRDEFGFKHYKVPGRAVYCRTFRSWLASCILCHVVYRLDPPFLPTLSKE